ncbi:MAG: hypothetical protein OXU42_03190 [Deltaproteobacteria bacterium]|nr:hypothetical protein [Deltaproteobacteria bacterium]
MKLADFDLRQDPFPIVPDGPVRNWAGRRALQEHLIDLVKGVRARDIGVTEFAVLHGEYGAGKSHALRYLKTLVDEDAKEFRSLAVYLERPRVAAKLNFLELYKYIIHCVGRDVLRKICSEVRDKTDKTIGERAEAAGVGYVADRSSFVEPTMGDLPAQDRSMVRLLRRGVDEEERVLRFLSGQENCSGDEYDGKIDSDFLAAKVLADLFRVVTAELRPSERIYESVYLFLDEGELLIDAKATESELVFSGLRELINGLPYRFGLLISFSAATALIEAIMSQHLLKRLTMPYIEVPMLEDSEAKEFLRSQLDHSRVEDSGHAGTFFPFEEEAIDFIIENTTALTPRNLFIDCKRVFERAFRRFGLEAGETISRDIAEKILVGFR